MSGSAPADTVVIPLHEEELTVGRRTVAGETVTVRTVTTLNDTVVDELLANERVEIERVSIRQVIETAPPIREEGDTIIIPVLEEVLVTERRLFLKEEVHIRRVRSTSRHHEIVTLREQNAVVTRTGAAQPDTVSNLTFPRNNDEESVMASETIVAVFATESLAELAVSDLTAAGVPASSIEHFSQTGHTGMASDAGMETGRSHSGFWSWLTGETDEATTSHAAYDTSLSSGHTVVTVVADAARADEITALLEKHKPLDVDQHGGTYQPGAASGAGTVSGVQGNASTLNPTIPAQSGMNNTGMGTGVGTTGVGTTGGTIGTGAAVAGTGEQVLSLSEETLQVGKREIDRGTTRVRRYVVERPVEEQIRLRDERVSVFRRPVTTTTAGIGDSFSDKVIEVTETDEEAVVGKTARVVEEVVVQKAVDERVETIKDTVRHEDVEIDKAGGTTATTTSTTTGVR